MRKNIYLTALSLAALITIGNNFSNGNGKASNLALAAGDDAKKPHLDLAFCIDTTGSMQSEIDQVKEKVKSLTAKLAAGKPAPVVRVGLVAYRDRGDEYVTKVFPFTEDIDHFVKDVSALQAAGGGDGPEAVNQGLHAAVHDLKWDDAKHTAKLMFLIGDAPPHAYPNDFKWEDEAKEAISRGIQVNTIACAGLEQYGSTQGAEVFKQIAKLADGSADTLTYRQTVVNRKGEKETVVSFGGDSYRVKSSTADWKSGVASLRAMGAADKIDAPMAASMATSMSVMAESAPMMSSRAMPMGAARGFASSSFSAGSAGSAGGAGGGGMGGISRGDSNLDEIVVQAAKKRAAKVSNVDYGGK